MDDKKRIILIGRSMAGKTTLCQYLNNEDLKYHKTQTVQLINDKVIDTPGEYLERTYLRGALTVTAVDADIIALVQQADEAGTMFPPGYSSTFGKPCIGIVTKSDLASPKQIKDAERYLVQAGAEEVFVTSSYKGSGFKPLLRYFETRKQESDEGHAEGQGYDAGNHCRR
ncbi:MAG TPA: EutP/PduV family microcompartment system protein [Candidatus Pelethocola excrementipullorum]|nr:EutP/PduV family microcompartment system protein [Candidatus Pelethocola excrementipullorum]